MLKARYRESNAVFDACLFGQRITSAFALAPAAVQRQRACGSFGFIGQVLMPSSV